MMRFDHAKVCRFIIQSPLSNASRGIAKKAKTWEYSGIY